MATPVPPLVTLNVPLTSDPSAIAPVVSKPPVVVLTGAPTASPLAVIEGAQNPPVPVYVNTVPVSDSNDAPIAVADVNFGMLLVVPEIAEGAR